VSISKSLRIARAPHIRPQSLADLAGPFAREKRLMAKVARQVEGKKATKATTAPVKPVKQALTGCRRLCDTGKPVPRCGPSAWHWRVRAPRPSEGQSAQGSGTQGRHAHPQSCDWPNGRGGGQTRERAGEDPCSVEAEGGCEPVVLRSPTTAPTSLSPQTETYRMARASRIPSGDQKWYEHFDSIRPLLALIGEAHSPPAADLHHIR
jgi:hypothetical protein